eukprot:7837105-Pyramimonas_sp.AAC.1
MEWILAGHSILSLEALAKDYFGDAPARLVGQERSAVLWLPLSRFNVSDLGPYSVKPWHHSYSSELGHSLGLWLRFGPGDQNRDNCLQL